MHSTPPSRQPWMPSPQTTSVAGQPTRVTGSLQPEGGLATRVGLELDHAGLTTVATERRDPVGRPDAHPDPTAMVGQRLRELVLRDRERQLLDPSRRAPHVRGGVRATGLEGGAPRADLLRREDLERRDPVAVR